LQNEYYFFNQKIILENENEDEIIIDIIIFLMTALDFFLKIRIKGPLVQGF
jgi:hypothetical protein